MGRTECAFLAIIGCLLSAATVGADEAKQPLRRPYSAGPLTAEDFRAKPVDDEPFAAWTSVEMQFRFAYKYRTQNKQTVVTLTGVDVWSEVERDKSWNRRPGDPLLLDHEQGHFDITHAHALQAQADLRKALGTAAAMQARATSEKAAVTLLEQKLHAELKRYGDDARAANRQYDKDTANGTDVAAQAEARRAQKERIKQLLAHDESPAP